ncbi:MAG: glycosyltransferase [Candidatus Dormibacteraeota bacterium]|nr:glycosyltransferase [Candidatus Dormibacteraeota bacterium]
MTDAVAGEPGEVAGAEGVDLPPIVDVELGTLPLERFAEVLTDEEADALRADARVARETFSGRIVWNVNSTATGGGVAEMLQSLVPYARGAGVDARWSVIQGDEDFFAITKRLHNRLHGSPGDGGELDAAARTHYEAVLEVNAARLIERLQPHDIVTLHDPQTAGLVPLLQARGNVVLWRCHVGVDTPDEVVRSAWSFLLPYVRGADACIFSTRGFVWEGLEDVRLAIIPPSIDPFAVKNYEIKPDAVSAILSAAGIEDNGASSEPSFTRMDGTAGTVAHQAEITESGRLDAQTPIVVQVSRWDRLKDPLGVLSGFTEHVLPRSDAHLVLAGPSVTHVADDPEGLRACSEVQTAWHALPADAAARVHLVTLPMDDLEENAVLVNALQRRAAVVVQKSLAEGFGLTVAEAMWKTRPVVASALGGIRDQIEDGETGLLVDPRDLAGFGDAVLKLLGDPDAAERMGAAAHERIRTQFLGSRHLGQYLRLISDLMR